MPLKSSFTLRSDSLASQPLTSPAIPVLCGLAWLGVAIGFAYLDRRYGRFGIESLLWVAWGAIGYVLGAVRLARRSASPRAAQVLTVLALLLSLFPGFLMFTLLRWGAFSLLLLTAARAAGMQRRGDLYFSLAAIVSVSLLVAVHGSADWTGWFYLGPAWLLVALALAWDYASDVELPALRKAGMTLAFMGLCLALALAVFAIVPRPHILGFGFLPPPTDTPGRVKLDSGSAGDRRGGQAGNGSPGQQSGGGGSPSPLQQGLDRMREALRDATVPRWQRSLIEGLLAGGEALARIGGSGEWSFRPMTASERAEAAARARAVLKVLAWLLLLMMLALLVGVLWLLRLRIGVATALALAGLLVRWQPAASMRCSAWAVRWSLRRAGHPLLPGQSVQEHVESASQLPGPVRQWLRAATDTYGAWRFGSVPPSSAAAAYMLDAAIASDEVIRRPQPPKESTWARPHKAW